MDDAKTRLRRRKRRDDFNELSPMQFCIGESFCKIFLQRLDK